VKYSSALGEQRGMKNIIFDSAIVTLTSSAKADCPLPSRARKLEGTYYFNSWFPLPLRERIKVRGRIRSIFG